MCLVTELGQVRRADLNTYDRVHHVFGERIGQVRRADLNTYDRVHHVFGERIGAGQESRLKYL